MASLELAALESVASMVSLTAPRLVALFAVLPFFSGSMLPGMARNGLVLMLALFMAPLAGAESAPASLALWLAIAAKEALIGTLLGMSLGIFVWALQGVGELIDFQTGSGNAAMFDPVAGHQIGPTAQFLGWLVMILFISSGGLLALVGVIVDSYRLWPVASFFPKTGLVLEQFVVRQGDTLFQWTVKLAAPVICVLVLVEVGMGLISRVAPQLNVFVLAQPLKSLLAHLMLLLCLYLVYASLQDFLRPDNGVIDFLRAAL
jgi:type III secretion protein T